MTRYTLTLTFDVKKALTKAQIGSARSLLGKFAAEDGLPAGMIVDVAVTRVAQAPGVAGEKK